MSNNNKIIMSEQELRQKLYRFYYKDFKNSTHKLTNIQTQLSPQKQLQLEQHLKEYFSLSFKLKKSHTDILKEVNTFTKRLLTEQENDTIPDSDTPPNPTDQNTDTIFSQLQGRQGLLPYNIDASMFDLLGNLSSRDVLNSDNIQGILDITSIVASISATKEKVALGAIIATTNIVNRIYAINKDQDDWSFISWDTAIIFFDALAILPYIKLLKHIGKIKPLFNVISPSGKTIGTIIKKIFTIGDKELFEDIIKLINIDTLNLKADNEYFKTILEVLRSIKAKIANIDIPSSPVNLDFDADNIITSFVGTNKQKIQELYTAFYNILEKIKSTDIPDNADADFVVNLINPLIKNLVDELSDYFSIAINFRGNAGNVSKFEAFKDTFKFLGDSIPVLNRLNSAETKALSKFIDGMGKDLAWYANLRVAKGITAKLEEAAIKAQKLLDDSQYQKFVDSAKNLAKNDATGTAQNFVGAEKLIPTSAQLGDVFMTGGFNALDDVAQNTFRQLSFILDEAMVILNKTAKNSDEVADIISKHANNLDDLANATRQLDYAASNNPSFWVGFMGKFGVVVKNIDELIITTARPQWQQFKNYINLSSKPLKTSVLNSIEYLIKLQRFLTDKLNLMKNHQSAIEKLAKTNSEYAAFRDNYNELINNIEALVSEINLFIAELKKFDGLFDLSLLDEAENMSKMSEQFVSFQKATDKNSVGIFSRIMNFIKKIKEIFFDKEFNDVYKKINNTTDTASNGAGKVGFGKSIKNTLGSLLNFITQKDMLGSTLSAMLFTMTLVNTVIVKSIMDGSWIFFATTLFLKWITDVGVPVFIANFFKTKIIENTMKKSASAASEGSVLFDSIKSFFKASTFVKLLKYASIFEKSQETLAGIYQKIGGVAVQASSALDTYFTDADTLLIRSDDLEELNAANLSIPDFSNPFNNLQSQSTQTQTSYKTADVNKPLKPLEYDEATTQNQEAQQNVENDNEQEEQNIFSNIKFDKAQQAKTSTKIVSPKVASFSVNKKSKNDDINYANSLFVLAYRKAEAENFEFKLDATTLASINDVINKSSANPPLTSVTVSLPKSIFFDKDFSKEVGQEMPKEQKNAVIEGIKKIIGQTAEKADEVSAKVANYLFVQTNIDDGSFFSSLSNEAQVIISNYYKDLETIIFTKILEFCTNNGFNDNVKKSIFQEVLFNEKNKYFFEVRRLKRHKDLIFKKYEKLLDLFVPDRLKNNRSSFKPDQLQDVFNQLNIYKGWNSLCNEDINNYSSKSKNIGKRLNFDDSNKISFLLPSDKAAQNQFNSWVEENNLVKDNIISINADNNPPKVTVTVNDAKKFLQKLTQGFSVDNQAGYVAPYVAATGILPGVDVRTEEGQFDNKKYEKMQNTLKLKSSLLAAVVNGSFGISQMGANSYDREYEKLHNALPPRHFKSEAASAYAASSSSVQLLFDQTTATAITTTRFFSVIINLFKKQNEERGTEGALENVEVNVENDQSQIGTKQEEYIKTKIIDVLNNNK